MRLFTLAALAALTMATVAARPAAAQNALEELDKKLREQLPPPPPGGDLPPPQALSPDSPFLGLFADMVEGRGVVVLAVHNGGPAEAAGIKRGDVITSIDGKAIRGIEDLVTSMEGTAIGKKLRIEVTRDGKLSTHNVTLTRRPAEPPRPKDTDLPLDPAAPRPAAPPEVRERASLGVRLTPLTDDARRRWAVTARSGAVIEGIREGSAADRFGLPLGAVIVSLDGRRIDSPDDVIAALRAARADEVEIGYYLREKLAHTRVRLAPAAPATPAELGRGPALDPALADRPGVKKLEGFLDRLIPPGAPPALGDPPGGRGEVAELRSEVEILKGEIDRLKRKISELEERLERK